MKDINSVNESFSMMTDYYCRIYNINTLPKFQLILTDDIYLESSKRMSELELKEAIIYKDNKEQLSGSMLYKTLDKPFFIFINTNQFNKQCEFVHTYYHELTHVIDFDRYMNELKVNNIQELREDKYYWTFYLWTEFHARYVGYSKYYDYLNYANGNEENTDERINFIENKEKPFHADYYDKQIGQYNTNLSKMPKNIAFQLLFYEVSQFYGRFSKWKEYGIEFEYENNALLNKFPNLKKELIDYYNILLKCKDYNGYEQHKDKIFDIVNELYKKI